MTVLSHLMMTQEGTIGTKRGTDRSVVRFTQVMTVANSQTHQQVGRLKVTRLLLGKQNIFASLQPLSLCAQQMGQTVKQLALTTLVNPQSGCLHDGKLLPPLLQAS